MIIPLRRSAWKAALLFLTTILLAGAAWAQAPAAGPTVSTQFDITGFVQEATLDGVGTGALQGGHLKVNGHVVTVPSNTIVILPANALTWQELFAQAVAPYAGTGQTGMALADLPAPMTTYEAHVVGNRVGDQYIAGLINISQHDLNSGAGFINFIDYALGEMRVGGTIVRDANGVPINSLDATNPGARVRINDPLGRYGHVITPDPRFTVDPDNPTIMSATGFPMCLPRVAPGTVNPDATVGDVLCPEGNRPKDLTGNFVTSLTMPDPATLAAGALPDPRIQAPFEVGDYVTFAGTLVTDAADPTTGPFPGTTGTYVSAHTIVNNIAIYTAPGTNPAYVMTEVTIIGTGGLTVLGAGEAVVRTRFEGMTTDPSRNIHLYGIDLDPATGATTDRDWGTIGVDPGPPLGAVKGRWRFRPPCLPFGSVTTKPDKDCIMNAAGTFLPPTREMRAVIEGLQSQNPANTHTPPLATDAKQAANGIFYGQYHAPILEYIFPENIPGTPIPPNNFETIPFMACGGYASSAGTLAGQLNPWPGSVAPTCAGAVTAPVASAGGPYTVASGGSLTLAGSATGTPTPTFAWSATAGTFSDAAIATPVFTAPLVAVQTTVNLTLTATNSAGSNTATTTVTVNAAAAPTVNHIAPVTVTSGTPVTLTATGADPGGLPLTFSWLQTSGTPVVLSPNPKTGATQTFTVTLPVGTTTPTVLQFQVTATNSAGVSSAPEFTSVTIGPPVDNDVITSAVYRTGKQRLVMTATSSVISPNVTLTLQPYRTAGGTTFDPATLGSVFTNTGGGLYTLTLVGAPEPAIPPATPLVVTSNLGGRSAPSALTQIRQ